MFPIKSYRAALTRTTVGGARHSNHIHTDPAYPQDYLMGDVQVLIYECYISSTVPHGWLRQSCCVTGKVFTEISNQQVRWDGINRKEKKREEEMPSQRCWVLPKA